MDEIAKNALKILSYQIDQSKAEIILPDEWPQVFGYPAWIEEIWTNYLSNALKYNRKNGSVILKTESHEKEMVISVQDTGVGVPEDAVGHIFEKFYRVRESETKISGTGLGLSICKKIVQGHGGAIEIKSKIGIGTNILVSLPRVSKTTPR